MHDEYRSPGPPPPVKEEPTIANELNLLEELVDEGWLGGEVGYPEDVPRIGRVVSNKEVNPCQLSSSESEDWMEEG
jgi:hypothetical protein